MRHSTLLLATILLAGWSPAQAGAEPRPTALPGPRTWTHSSWTTETGLPENTVHTLLQDSSGYLWVGTYGGLARFDGVRFQPMDLGPDVSPALGVYSLLEDPRGGLWVGTAGGGLVKRRTDGGIDHFTSRSTGGALPSDAVRALALSANGDLLAGTDAGLARLSGDRWSRVGGLEEKSSAAVRSLLTDARGAWVGTAGAGLLRLTSTGLVPDPRVSGDVTALAADGQGGLFAGTAGGGVVELLANGETRVWGREQGLPDPVVKSLALDRSGGLWIGTNGGGLARLARDAVEIPDTGEALRSTIVQALLEDREGNVFVGTLVRGLHRLRKAPVLSWTQDHGLPHRFVKGLAPGRSGLWISTNGGGLARLDSSGIHPGPQVSSPILMTVFEDSRGTLWAAAYLGGLDRIEHGRTVDHWSSKNGLSNDTVTALAEDPAGRIWAGTYGGGLNRFPAQLGRRPEHVALREGGGNDVVRALLSHADELWVGTNDGLYLLRDAKKQLFTTDEGLGSNVVTALLRDPDGTLWIGTRGGGLSRWRAGRIQTVRQREGLHHDTVYSVLDDGRGCLWMSSEHGISRVSRAALDDFFSSKSPFLSSEAFEKADGLPSAQGSGGFQGAGVKGPGGRLYFATIEGLAAVDPAALPRNAMPPPVVVEEVISEKEAKPARGELVFPPGRERLEIRYAGLALGAPEKVRFRFRLEGFDPDWVEAGSRRTAFYTNVPPGQYRFEVVAQNQDGVLSPAPAWVEIRLTPRFTQTRIFYALLAFAALGLSLGAHRLRLRVHQHRERELAQLVRERTESLAAEHRRAVDALAAVETAHTELSLTNEALRAADALKSEMLGIAAHDLKNPLAVIRGFAELLQMRLQDAVAVDMATRIRRSADSMLSIVGQLLDSAALESGQLLLARDRVDLSDVVSGVIGANQPQAQRKQQSLGSEVEAEVAVIGDRDRLAQVVENLVDNAIKYSPPGKPIRVRLARLGEHARLEVEDEGPGLSVPDREKLFGRFQRLSARPTGGESSSGLGLSIVKQLVEMHGGRVFAESEGREQGSRFVVELPLL